MKKKSLSLLLSGLLTVCLTGVGFASWLIVEGDTENQIAGTVNVETIDSKKTEISYTWANNAGTEANITSNSDGYTDKKDEWDNLFSFGAPANATTGWLTNTGGIKECLTLSLNVTVTNAQYLVASNCSVDLTVESDKLNEAGATDASSPKTGYDWAKEKGYIQPFTASIAGDGEFDGEFTVEIKTGWGEKFDTNNDSPNATGDTNANDNLNPYTYYNARKSSEYAEDAADTLTLLQLYLSSVTFKLVITASVDTVA